MMTSSSCKNSSALAGQRLTESQRCYAVIWKTSRMVAHYIPWASTERETVSLLSYDYSLDCDLG